MRYRSKRQFNSARWNRVLRGANVDSVVALRKPDVLAEALESRILFSTFSVSTVADSGAGSLRQAIINSNAAGGTNTIKFFSGIGGSFPTTGTVNLLSELPTITNNVTIQGSGEHALTINGNGFGSVFTFSNVSGDISAMKIEGGNAISTGGGIDNIGGNLTLSQCYLSGNTAEMGGGGIYNNGTMTVVNSNLFKNTATFSGSNKANGGGIYNLGSLTITNSAITGNAADESGGGIFSGRFNNNYDSVNVTDCTISGNSALNGSGGGINGEGFVYVTGSSVTGNYAAYDGGGISGAPKFFSNIPLTMIVASTISNNISEAGGGINVLGPLAVIDSTVSGNVAESDAVLGVPGVGGGIFNAGSYRFAPEFLLANTTITGNSARRGTAAPSLCIAAPFGMWIRRSVEIPLRPAGGYLFPKTVRPIRTTRSILLGRLWRPIPAAISVVVLLIIQRLSAPTI